LSVPNSQNTPKTAIIANGRQRHNCIICKSDRENALNTDYLRGYGVKALERIYGFHRQSVDNHIHALGLKDKRDNSTLKKVNKLLNTALKEKDREYGDALVAKCLELRAKLTGELDDRPTNTTNILQVTTTERNDRLKRGLEQFGVKLLGDKGVPHHPDADEVQGE
jgi:hypothetical protein